MEINKQSTSISSFDEDFRLRKLNDLGDPLQQFSNSIDFDIFSPILTEILPAAYQNKEDSKPIDYMLMFKILVLQRYYNLSDEETEFQIADRLSFMRFLGLTLADNVPDSKTIRLFKKRLIALDLAETLFSTLDAGYVEVAKQPAVVYASGQASFA